MSLHKLQLDRDARPHDAPTLAVSMEQSLGYLGDALMRARIVQDCEFDPRQLPVYRTVRWSVRRKVELFFDDLALDSAFIAYRVRDGSALLSAPGALVYANGYNKAGYTSGCYCVWAQSVERLDEIVARLDAIAGPHRMRDEAFTFDWHFTAANGESRSTTFEELADPSLLDEAYPSLGASVRDFISGYLNATECVLILLGPPGTGKTRLVRAILAEMSRRKGENAEVMYTADKRALAGDEIFVEFITGSHDAFVIEDTDHLLKARTSGNEEMHRFLAIADGVARSSGRKVIFTTNLPNVNDIDDALTRPGRCHAVKNLRSLTLAEAQRLAARICGADEERARRVGDELAALNARTYSVAQVYRACA